MGSGQWAVGSGQWAAGNERQQVVGSWQWATGGGWRVVGQWEVSSESQRVAERGC